MAASVLAASPASAETRPPMPAWYFGGMVGAAATGSGSVDATSGFYHGAVDNVTVPYAGVFGGINVARFGTWIWSVGPMLDVMFDTSTSYRGTGGGAPVIGYGSLNQANLLGFSRLTMPLANGFDFSFFAAGGAAMVRPAGTPTGFGGPGIIGNDTVAALRVGAEITRQVSETVSIGAQLAYQRTNKARLTTTLPGEEFDFGSRDTVMAGLTISFNPPPPVKQRPVVNEPPKAPPSRGEPPPSRGGGGQPPPPPATLSDTKPVPDDPKDGIPVTDGKLHRYTGTYERSTTDKRSGIFCWVEVDGTAKCKDFRFYQWACAEIVSVDWGDGKGAVKPDPKTKGKATGTGTGAKFKIGHWNPDDHSWTRHKYPKKKLVGGTAIAGCDDTKVDEAAPYGAMPPPIPGAPAVKDAHDAPNEQKWLQQFADAPSMAGGASSFMADIFGKHGSVTKEKPAPQNPITIVLKYNFRVALYCDKNCLGSFEWSAEETVEVTPTVTEVKNTFDEVSYKLDYVGKRIKNPPVTITAWKPGPC
jgi:hypothetical protein